MTLDDDSRRSVLQLEACAAQTGHDVDETEARDEEMIEVRSGRRLARPFSTLGDRETRIPVGMVGGDRSEIVEEYALALQAGARWFRGGRWR